jgi:hypothetical protein
MDRNVNVNMIGQFTLQASLQVRENFSKPRGVEPLTDVAVKTGVFDCVTDSLTFQNGIAGLCVSYLLVRRSGSGDFRPRALLKMKPHYLNHFGHVYVITSFQVRPLRPSRWEISPFESVSDATSPGV